MTAAVIVAGFVIGTFGLALDSGEPRTTFLSPGFALLVIGVALILWGYNDANLPVWLWD